jgi:hypothetical protein
MSDRQGSGVMGKVTDAQSIVVPSTATGKSSAPMRALSPPITQGYLMGVRRVARLLDERKA